jgi:hypothetical protein
LISARLALATLVALGLPPGAAAQRGPRPAAPSNGAGAGVAFVSFGPDDADIPGWFEITAVAPVVAYTRPGLSVAFFRATDGGDVGGLASDLELVDVTFLLHNDLRVFGPPVKGRLEPLVPIVITSSFRRVQQTRDNVTLSLFEYQTLGIGSGIGARAERSRWIAEARATPTVAFASRSFGGTVGFVWGLDAGAWLNVGPLAGPVGLTVGYGFSWKRWRVGGPEAVAVAGSGRFNYTGYEHALRLGLSW